MRAMQKGSTILLVLVRARSINPDESSAYYIFGPCKSVNF